MENDDSEVENDEEEEENDEEEADDEDNAEEDQVTLPLSETLRFAPALPPATNDEDHDGQAVNLDEGDTFLNQTPIFYQNPGSRRTTKGERMQKRRGGGEGASGSGWK